MGPRLDHPHSGECGSGPGAGFPPAFRGCTHRPRGLGQVWGARRTPEPQVFGFATCPAGREKIAYLLRGASRPLARRHRSAVPAGWAGAGLQGRTLS